MNIIATSETEKERAARVRASYWLPTQARWIASKRRIKLMAKTRRFGGSYANNYCMTERAGMKGNPFDAWIGSRDLLAARLSVNDCKLFSKVLKQAARDNGEVFLDDERKLKAFEIEFGNGKFVRGLSSSPDAFAGKQGWITLDEFALHKNPRQLYGIVQPGIMRGGSLSIISTHRGTANFFNELVKEIKEKGNPKKVDYFEINIVDAVKEGLWLKIQQSLKDSQVEDERLGWTDEQFLQSLRDECASDEMWNQEYMCIPCDDASALLTWEELLDAACTELELSIMLGAVPITAPRFIGMDIGRHNHPSVIWQWVQYNGYLIEEKVIPLPNMKFAEQEKVIAGILHSLPSVVCCMDQTGMGMQMSENMADAYPGKVVPVTFSQSSRLAMAMNAKRKFQDRKVQVSDTTKHLYELYSIKQRSGSADSIVITADASMTEKHSDYAWAAFLGLYAAERPKSALEVILI